MKFLVGERIHLRPIERSDAPLIASWFNRAEVRRTTRRYLPLSVGDEEKFIEQHPVTERDVVFAIVWSEDDRLVGVCGLHALDVRARFMELGLAVGDPADWNRGIGGEAMALLVDYGFGELNLNRIHLTVHADNPPAVHLYERLGFRVEGTLRQHAFREGKYIDVITMGLLASEWLARSG
jgi:RimJ/RimL family protein N-acetyltransferase